ncbi:peptidylprolyl isomerase [Leeia sp.]|uniref:peptidylprolyl isomerase n=1 Tax=Leeia sp. TaxID=2884678 RepID=UPI0035AD7F25
MPICVNQHELTDDDVAREIVNHQQHPNPTRAATESLVIRHVLLDEAERLGLRQADDEASIDALLQSQVNLPTVDEDSCQRHYQQHPARFTVGERVEVSHILFQVTPGVSLPALRAQAETVLQQLQQTPERFDELAQRYSNCPSAAVGGQLGQLGRGECVPEFERVVFNMSPGLLPQLLESRHGLHIVWLARRINGHLLPYAHVADQIKVTLQAWNQDIAWRQYVHLLVGKARISGIELTMSDSPLVQ